MICSLFLIIARGINSLSFASNAGKESTMNQIVLLALTCVLIPRVLACANIDGINIHGESHNVGGLRPARILKRSFEQSSADQLSYLRIAFSGLPDNDFSIREREGVECLFNGNYDRAVELFKQNEADQPGRYSTAANLGTAYELTGDLESALKWISEGIVRNPESHEGTEWLHVMILKSRIKLKQDPTYLDKNRVLDIPEQVSGKTTLDLDSHRYSVDRVANALLYQLKERMVFVKPPDPVVADLLFAYARLEAGTMDVESGLQLLTMAQDYGFRDQTLFAKETDRFNSAIFMGKVKKNALIGLGILAFLAFVVFALKKKWLFISGSAYRRHRDGTA